jgi:hypothetical protein
MININSQIGPLETRLDYLVNQLKEKIVTNSQYESQKR